MRGRRRRLAKTLRPQWCTIQRSLGRFHSLRQRPWLSILSGWPEAGPHHISCLISTVGARGVHRDAHRPDGLVTMPDRRHFLDPLRPVCPDRHRTVPRMGRQRIRSGRHGRQGPTASSGRSLHRRHGLRGRIATAVQLDLRAPVQPVARRRRRQIYNAVYVIIYKNVT